MSCGAETEANDVMTSLIAGVSFPIPTVDLDGPEFDIPTDTLPALPAAITVDQLTDKTVGGSGVFDVIMGGINSHLSQEFQKGRITGAEYSKVYLGALEAALGNSVQFLLQKDNAYWQAVRAQYEARQAEAMLIKARVDLVTAKVQLATVQYAARTQEATYALTKMKLATESIAYCTAKYNLDNILPVQKTLVTEQAETARAQTMDTRSDGATAIVGVIGKQKDLYSQQITSYQRDAEVKTAKLFTDAWITMKTMDEGLLPPTKFQNTSLDSILATLITNNAL